MKLSAKAFKLVPIGVRESANETARIKIFQEYCEGLYQLQNFSHLIILYWFHKRDNETERTVLHVTPKRHHAHQEVGVFASRSPSRPNPIGLCVVKLLRIEDCTLIVEGLDAQEGSPIIDIKPYLPRSDCVQNAKVPEWTHKGPTT